MPNHSHPHMTAPLLRFARYRDIAVDVASLLSEGGLEAIVASSGVAAAITAEALRNAPRGAVSLRLPTIEHFARQVVNAAGEYPRIATDAEQRLAARSAARVAADLILDTNALGAMLQRSYRDVRDSGLTIDAFESRLRAASVRNRRRIDAMIRAWREYERLIEQLGTVDPADVLLRASQLVNATANPQIIAGFYDMTGAQLQLVSALAKAEKLAAIYVPTTEDEPFVTNFVAALPHSALGTRHSALQIKTAAPTIAQYETKFVELHEICRAIAKLIAGGTSPLSIGIVARGFEPYDIRLLHRFAAEFGFNAAAAETMPLIAHRIGRAAVSILRMRDRNFSRADVIDLLRDGFETSRRLDLDIIDRDTRKAQIAGGTGDAIRSVADYAAAVGEIEPLAPAVALRGSDWSALLTAMTKRFRIETDSDIDAIDRISEIAAVLQRASSWNRRFDAEAIIDLLTQLSLTTDATKEPAVWIGDVMRFRGRTFEHLFVARMQDDIFPQRRRDDPLLPDADRHILGLREIGDGTDEERLLFKLLQDGAGTSIHFTLAGTDGLGNLLRPSPLIKQLAIEREPNARAEILRDFSNRFAAAPVEDSRPRQSNARQLQRIAFAGTRSTFDGYLDLNDAIRARITDALQSLSPTALEDFGECPQKFLWKHVLGVRDLDEPELELHVNARDKGKLDHTVLEKFYRLLQENDIAPGATLEPELCDRLDQLVDEVFDAFESRTPPFNPAMRGIERRSTKRHLRAFVAADLTDLHASGMRPAHVEYAFGSRWTNADHREPFVIAAHDIPMTIEGRIDRIDAANDRMRVIDYKSGKAIRHQDLAKKIDRGVRMQLALYAMAVAEFFNRDESQISGAIKPLRGGKDTKFSFDLANHAARLRETLDIFAAAILAGRFPAFPNEKDNEFDSCAYCPVNHSCRTKHDDTEKYAVTRYEDPRTLLSND